LASDYIEYSEDFSTKYIGKEAIYKKIQYRLSTFKNEIPYDSLSIDSYLFNQGSEAQFLLDVKRLLGDITTNVKITRDGRVLAAGVEVPLSLSPRGI
jgi:hypothetical protein